MESHCLFLGTLFYLSTSITKWVGGEDYLWPKKSIDGSGKNITWITRLASSIIVLMNNSASSSSRLWERLLNKLTYVWKNVQGTYLQNQSQPIEEIRQNIFCDISSIGWDWLSREVPCTFFLCGHLAIDINCTQIALTEGTKSLPFSPPIYFNIVSFKVEFSLGSLHKLIWSKVISSLNPLLLVQ